MPVIIKPVFFSFEVESCNVAKLNSFQSQSSFLFQNAPAQFQELLRYSRSLSFSSPPQYSYLKVKHSTFPLSFTRDISSNCFMIATKPMVTLTMRPNQTGRLYQYHPTSTKPILMRTQQAPLTPRMKLTWRTMRLAASKTNRRRTLIKY